jgi:TonB-dependent SusC/RagA subfamily outer membrane receptor
LNPDFIEGITIIKGEDAIKMYGEKGKNGVVLIKTKIKTALNSNRNYDDIMENEPE